MVSGEWKMIAWLLVSGEEMLSHQTSQSLGWELAMRGSGSGGLVKCESLEGELGLGCMRHF